MTVMAGKHALMRMLQAEGVKYVFGNPGTSETPIMEALESYPDLRYVLAAQEGVAVGMADGYARATGTPSFVSLHIDVGLANGISLLHGARRGGSPMVVVAANKDVREAAHERTNLVQMVRQFTKWSGQAAHPGAVAPALQRAFSEAKSPPTGPAFVEISANALDGEAEVEIVPSPAGGHGAPPDPRSVEDAARVLAGASNPIALVGDRLAESGGVEEAVRIAEILGARVYATSYAEMVFPTGHPLFMGRIRLGSRSTSEMLSDADAALAVGRLANDYYQFSQPALRYLGPETRLVHVDSDAGEVGGTQRTEVGIVADPAVALGALRKALEEVTPGTDREAAKSRALAIEAETRAARHVRRTRAREDWDRSPMTAARMMAEVAAELPEDAILVDDSISSRDALHGAMEFTRPGAIIGERGAVLGWGMGAALGVKLARPDRPVVAIVGDGSAMMTVQALWTAATEGILVVYLVCNNGAYRVLKLNMDAYRRQVLRQETGSSRYIGMDFAEPFNIAGMAEANGVFARSIRDPDELGAALREALELGRPAVLDVHIDGSV